MVSHFASRAAWGLGVMRHPSIVFHRAKPPANIQKESNRCGKPTVYLCANHFPRENHGFSTSFCMFTYDSHFLERPVLHLRQGYSSSKSTHGATDRWQDSGEASRGTTGGRAGTAVVYTVTELSGYILGASPNYSGLVNIVYRYSSSVGFLV